jgi:DNA repair protein RadC
MAHHPPVDLPVSEQPRTRLIHYGAQALSDTELLAIILGAGMSPLNAVHLATRVLANAGSLNELHRLHVSGLQQIAGVTPLKAAQLAAALELASRQPAERLLGMQITCPADAAHCLMPLLRYQEQEHLCVLVLNTRNYVLHTATVYVGTLNSAPVRLCEVFRPALRCNGAAILVAHNHPSGCDLMPSLEDISLTRQLITAGELLGIAVTDHLVIGDGHWLSMRERRLGFNT